MPDDRYGIKEIYPSKTGGESWSKDSETFSGQTRFAAQTSSGFDQDETERRADDQKQMAQDGYMQDAKDWRNIEMSGWFENTSGSDEEFTMYCRTARHTSDGYCPGFAYKISFAYGANEVRLAKECWHVSYDFTDWQSADLGGWENGDKVGLKCMFYNVNQSGNIYVKCEAWVDKDRNNNWTKAWEYLDDGGLGDGCEDCGGDPDQIGTWGGPLAVFRTDEGEVRGEKLTVREINPGGPVGSNDPVSGGGCTEGEIGTGGGTGGETGGTVSGLVYQVTGRSSDDFEDWGRDTTNYASGGSGASRRWNLMQEGSQRFLNCIVVAKINIGNDLDSDDNAGIKFRGCTHDDSNGGWYSIGVEFNGKPHFGKEYPHPSTDHYGADGESNSMGSIKGKNIALQCIMFNDGNTPTMELWHDITGQGTNWKFGGKLRDTGQLDPGPILDEIGERGDDCQQIQLRIDEAPDAKLINAVAYEMKSPAVKNTAFQVSNPMSPPPLTLGEEGNDPLGIKKLYASGSGGGAWYSTSWDGDSRTVPEDCGTDPDDPITKHRSNDNSECTIDGNGVMKLTQDGRVAFMQSVTNSEATTYVRASSGYSGILHLQPKTEHYCLSNDSDRFGGYIVYIDWGNDAVYFKKEQSHSIGYSGRLAQVSYNLNTGQWYGVKGMAYNMGSGVKLECWMDTTDGANGGDWKKITEVMDDGNIMINDAGKSFPPVTGQVASAAVRTDPGDAGGFLEFKKTSVREITTDAPTPGSGGGGTGTISENWDFENKGGKVINRAVLNLIFWGSYWSSAVDPSKTDIVNSVAKLVTSNYWNILGLYNIQKPIATNQGVVEVSTTNVVTKSNVAILIADNIRNLNVPAPQEDSGNIYIVIMNPNQTLDSSFGVSNTASTHGWISVGGGTGGIPTDWTWPDPRVYTDNQNGRNFGFPTGGAACGNNFYKSPNQVIAEIVSIGFEDEGWDVYVKKPDGAKWSFGDFINQANAEAYRDYLLNCTAPSGGATQPTANAAYVLIPTKNYNRDDITRKLSQQITNAITNPFVDGSSGAAWVAKDSSRCQSSEVVDAGTVCELGDYCSNVRGTANTVQVTGIWSNTDEKCVVDGVYTQPAVCGPNGGVDTPGSTPSPGHVAASALVIYSVDGWGVGGQSQFPGNALSPIPEPPELEDGFVGVHATVLYNNGSNFDTDPGGGSGGTDAGNVFPEEAPPVGEIVLFSRHRYNIAVYSTTHCLNP